MSENKQQIKVIVSGGGTGGHIFPALAIANAIKRRIPGCEILFVGAEGRMEMEKVPAAGYEIVGLPVAGFDRKRIWRNFSVLIKLWKSLRKADSVILQFKPDAVVGVGGYASGPVLKKAQKKNIPTLLQEQNSYAGVTNKLLAAKADAICVAYPDMARFFPGDKIIMTGNPVRRELLQSSLSSAEAKEKIGFDPSKPLLFVTGGSLGARTVNRSVIRMLPQLQEKGIQLLWQTGKLYAKECAEAAGPYANVKATPFIEDMAIAYRAADLVVARAGACTISELQLLAKPCILIPSPNVAEDHQRKNAEALATRDAAVMILDCEAEDKLVAAVTALIDNIKMRESMADNIKKMALPDSDEKIVDALLKIIS